MKKNKRILSTVKNIGIAGHIVQDCEKVLRELSVDYPCVIHVDKGMKKAFNKEFSADVYAGEALVLNSSVSLNIQNENGKEGVYESRWIAFDLEFMKKHIAEAVTSEEICAHMKDGADFTMVFNDTFEAIYNCEDYTLQEVTEKVKRLAVWLSRFDFSRFFNKEKSLSGDISQIISADLSKRWDSGLISKMIGMSESTLRRRLAAENVTISGVVSEVRMSAAMGLLQSTDMSITEIAYETGYLSPSRFTARFKSRFGFPPSHIRGHRRDFR